MGSMYSKPDHAFCVVLVKLFHKMLIDSDVASHADKERTKRNNDRQKIEDKAAENLDRAIPPTPRARDLRAMSVGRCILVNLCTGCGKAIECVTPFEWI